MANPWFKFYGQDYLNDLKFKNLPASFRSCWITLLCYGSLNNGIIKYLTEDQLKMDAGIPIGSTEFEQMLNVLETFAKLDMIRIDNGVITIINWEKRQERPLTPYERVKKYREKKRLITDDNESDNDRIDKNRIDKNIHTVKKTNKKFIKPTLKEISDYCTERKNKVIPSKFLDHYESNGWRVGRNPMKDWRAAVRTWERSNFNSNSPPIPSTVSDYARAHAKRIQAEEEKREFEANAKHNNELRKVEELKRGIVQKFKV